MPAYAFKENIFPFSKEEMPQHEEWEEEKDQKSDDEFNTPEAVSPKGISDLEREESDDQRRNQKAQWLKIFKTKSNT